MGSEMCIRDRLNEKPTLWQANWVEVGWPQGDTLLTKEGTRLWFQISLRDLSGQVENAWMNEKSALSLSRLADKEAFIESFTEGNQLFPIMSTVKVIREVKSSQDAGDVSQPADAKPAKKMSICKSSMPLTSHGTKHLPKLRWR